MQPSFSKVSWSYSASFLSIPYLNTKVPFSTISLDSLSPKPRIFLTSLIIFNFLVVSNETTLTSNLVFSGSIGFSSIY